MKAFFSSASRENKEKLGTAFIVEMLVLLVVVVSCLSVFIDIFATSQQKSEENDATVQAIHLATNAAEQFSANPTSVVELETFDNLVVHTVIDRQPQQAGTLYKATITVYEVDQIDEGDYTDPCYRLETARYVQAGGE